jgi:DNA gyrase subunit A
MKMILVNKKNKTVDIKKILRDSYIDYSMSVIVNRALPDARDGMKPVQRRILYAMFLEKLSYNRPFDKCAGVVGEVLKNYHPHGDVSVYDALVRLAQNWVMRYPLIDSQGNFGSIDGDPPAAYRYTEARLTKKSELMLEWINEKTVDFISNYKSNTVEPKVLPARLPNLLINGSIGIAVGMATSIPPHNLKEVVQSCCAVIDNPNILIKEIHEKYLKGPDFPTGGYILNKQEILKYMEKGKGTIKIRGKIKLEKNEKNRKSLVISEIPYGTNRSNIISKIIKLVNNKIITEISNIRDESDHLTRIVIELKKGEIIEVLINKLFKYTQLESSFGVTLLALDKGLPKIMNIKEMIVCYINHRKEITYRKINNLLNIDKNQLEILNGYLTACTNIKKIINLIKSSYNKKEAKIKIKDEFNLTTKQVNNILNLKIYKLLTILDKKKIKTKKNKIEKNIKTNQMILNSDINLMKVVKKDIISINEEYRSKRRTKILNKIQKLFKIEDVIVNESCIITITRNGFIKRTNIKCYKSQKRGGKGVIGTGQYKNDFVEHLFIANSHDYIMFFTNRGRVYVKRVYEIPIGSRISKGRSISNLFDDENIRSKFSTIVCIKKPFFKSKSLIMCTRNGLIKKTHLKEYSNFRKNGIIGIKVRKNDSLVNVKLAEETDEIMIITYCGRSIRFKIREIRSQKRNTIGVKGITLKKIKYSNINKKNRKLEIQDYVKNLEIVDKNLTLLIVKENGIGKRTKFEKYKIQKRGGKGIRVMKKSSSFVSGSLSITDKNDIMILTTSGKAIRIPTEGIRISNRTTKGVKLIKLKKDDKVLGMCKILKEKAF